MLARMVVIYCKNHHASHEKHPLEMKGILAGLSIKQIHICQECSKLLLHGLAKLLNCPYDPKPSCKHCTTHCYARGYRDFVKTVMRYSGLKLIKSGRIDLIIRYYF